MRTGAAFVRPLAAVPTVALLVFFGCGDGTGGGDGADDSSSSLTDTQSTGDTETGETGDTSGAGRDPSGGTEGAPQ